MRRSQNERSQTTRAKLRTATVETIVSQGYVKTTTAEIAERAGVSRGALLHHYPSKIDLIVDAAAEIWGNAAEEVSALANSFDRGELDIDTFVEGVWERVFPKNAVVVTLDLMSAARSDVELNTRMEVYLKNLFDGYDRIAEQAFATIGLSAEERRVMVLLTTSTIRGLRLQEMMHADSNVIQAVKDTLKTMLRQMQSSAEIIDLNKASSSYKKVAR